LLKPRLGKTNHIYRILNIQREFNAVSRLRVCGKEGNKSLPSDKSSLKVEKHLMKKQNDDTEDGNFLQKLCTCNEILNSVRLQRTDKNNCNYSTATQQM